MAGLIAYLSQQWPMSSKEVQIIFSVSALCSLTGGLIGWYLAWFVYES